MPQFSEVNFERELSESLAGYNRERLRESYEDQDCFLIIDDFLPKRVLETLLPHVERAVPKIHRTRIPGQKKGGSVPRNLLSEPQCQSSGFGGFGELYSSPELLSFLEDITGEALVECPPDDLHGYTLYCYTETGDHIGWHFDTSFYRGKRFTLLIGLVENSSCRLECEHFRRDPNHQSVHASYTLKPGTLAIFDGDHLWHRITPLTPGDSDRFALTMEFVTDPSMSPLRRLISNVKDASAYFGFKAVFLGAGRG